MYRSHHQHTRKASNELDFQKMNVNKNKRHQTQRCVPLLFYSEISSCSLFVPSSFSHSAKLKEIRQELFNQLATKMKFYSWLHVLSASNISRTTLENTFHLWLYNWILKTKMIEAEDVTDLVCYGQRFPPCL